METSAKSSPIVRQTVNAFLFLSLIMLFSLLTACSGVRKLPADHKDKVLSWSGYKWIIKESDNVLGPGNNYYTSSPKHVWVDEDGFLHMTIQKDSGIWYCTELILDEFPGYGKYTLEIASDVSRLDPNVVLGFFSWRHNHGRHNNEIDIELSRWGDRDGPNGQFVVQPYHINGHIQRFYFEQQGDYTTFEFTWLPFSVFFHGFHGHAGNGGHQEKISTWHFTSLSVPKPRKTNLRINLWLNSPTGPASNETIEVILKSFRFTPVS